MRQALEKTAIAAVSLALALTPCWLYMAVKFLLAPEGFWQNLLLIGVGVYFLGFIQFILIVLWLVFTLSVILG